MLELKLKRSLVILIMKVIKVSFIPVAKKYYIAAVSYLQNNLPFNKKILQYSQYLHPQKRNCSASASAISNICLKIVKMFGSKAPKIFELPLDSTL